jgi:hypothetical protein
VNEGIRIMNEGKKVDNKHDIKTCMRRRKESCSKWEDLVLIYMKNSLLNSNPGQRPSVYVSEHV